MSTIPQEPQPFPSPKKEPPIVTPGKTDRDSPSDAIVLFDGKDLSRWRSVNGGGDPKWKIKDGYVEVAPRTGDIATKEEFGDCQLHIEWATPSEVKGEGQERGNSGVFLMERYEVQVLDSYDNKTYYHGQAGAIYKQHAPLVNASRKPGEWQSYDIIFKAPKFDEQGKVTERARITVLHNGVLIQNNVEIYGNTYHDRPALYIAHGPKASLKLQDHGDPLRYRNIWIRPLVSDQGSIAEDTQNDLTPRGLYISKSADAMRVKVLDAKTGAAVSPSQKFTMDDRLKVIIESNFESYAYIVNVEIIKNSEKRFMLYPNPRAANNRIKPNEPLELSVTFDEKPATEVLQVIVSHDRIEYLNAALNGQCSESENRCLLDAQVAARVASIVGDSKSSRETETAGVFSRQSDGKPNQSGLTSRDIILAPGKDRDEKETYVAIPITAGSDGRLKSKQVVVFEMRLKHL